MSFFHPKKHPPIASGEKTDFGYLSPDHYYFDSACQTLRPQSVIDKEVEYYTQYNACGGRVKYAWGELVDTKVEEARSLLLNLLGVSAKHYCVAFTLNATYGINLVLQQLNPALYTRVVTSDIEHNSVFLPTQSFAQSHQKERLVLARDAAGNLLYERNQLEKAIVVLNTASNIDGRKLQNLHQLIKDTHDQGGIVFLDACQSLGHDEELLRGEDFDAVFASGHKMYGPSIGIVVIKKSLLLSLQPSWIGGGTVQDVDRDVHTLIADPDMLYARLELGLQNYAGIIGLGEAIKWRKQFHHSQGNAHQYEEYLSNYLWTKLQAVEKVALFGVAASPVVSLSISGLDSHQLALYLSQQNIMCRSGYFCCHYFLKHLHESVPLLRVSLGLHNTPAQIDYLAQMLQKLTSSL